MLDVLVGVIRWAAKRDAQRCEVVAHPQDDRVATRSRQSGRGPRTQQAFGPARGRWREYAQCTSAGTPIPGLFPERAAEPRCVNARAFSPQELGFSPELDLLAWALISALQLSENLFMSMPALTQSCISWP